MLETRRSYEMWGNEAGEHEQTRSEYLLGLAVEHGVDYDVVETLADMLGPNEDRDGLINALEDIQYLGWPCSGEPMSDEDYLDLTETWYEHRDRTEGRR